VEAGTKMREKRKQVALHLRSLKKLSSFIEEKQLGRLDSREWKEEWADRWVAYADLIAFAPRAIRSDVVVLNNIVRFDRACQIVAAEFQKVRLHRFSDATFAIANTFSEAIGFSIALSHSCLALNYEYLQHGNKPFFIHLIVPRITIAWGRVLLLPETPAHEARFSGIDPKNVVAGSAIVSAFYLEKNSAGGLITLNKKGIDELRNLTIRGHRGGNTNGLERWIKDLSNDVALKSGRVFGFRGNALDVPWLLLQPIQNDTDSLWAALPSDADFAVSAYLNMWDKSIREFYSPQSFDAPLDVAKHYQAAIRHAVHCYSISHGWVKPSYRSVSEIQAKLKSGQK
jgi:hypothetical protein